MNLKNTLEFLATLSDHNTKEWMDDNRAWYQEVRAEFIQLVDELIQKMLPWEPGLAGLRGKDCVFRINRDIRFSNNKDPYKTNFGAAISIGGKHSANPTYYLHVQPGESFTGGGIYMPEAEVLKKIRQEIDYNTETLLKILEDSKFKKQFGELRGDRLKTAPKGYPKDHPHLSLLQLKSFVVMRSFTDEEVAGEEYMQRVLECFETMKPLNNYLSTALD